jgi:carbon-monoxide dehydrogenase medium subunit
MTPAIELNEIVVGVRFPQWAPNHGYAFVEFARRHGDFAIAGVACLLALDAQGRIARAALALCGVEVTPLRLSAAEALLVGKEPSAEAFKSAAAVAGEVEAMSDAYVNAAYRKRLAQVLVERALASAAARARGEKNV